MIRTVLLIILIWLCLSQITLNQRQYAVKRIPNNRQSKDLKKISNRQNLNSNSNNNQNSPQSKQHYSHKKSFREYLNDQSSDIVMTTDDQWNNNVVNNWNSWSGPNSWTPPSWQTNNGWWPVDPWKDPYKRLSLVKIKPEIQEVYAADVLIRENRNSNFGGGCHETLGDFNPYGLDHSAPEYRSRHLGDLGNIEANSTGVAVFKFKDKQIKIQDKIRGIIGRSIVIHEFEDDMGLTQVKESKRSGDAGGRLACGVIGISQASHYNHMPLTCSRKN